MSVEFYAVLALGLILMFAYRLVALIRATPRAAGPTKLSVQSRDILEAEQGKRVERGALA